MPSIKALTDIELTILVAYADGFQYKEIAQKLCRSEANVKWHAMRCRDKLRARTMAHAVAVAVRNKVIA